MSLTAALHAAKSGLSATQTQIQGASDNVANALTPGYVAKEARVTGLAIEGRGVGVAAEMLRGPTNSRLLRDIRFETAAMAGFSYQADALAELSRVSGLPDEGRTIGAGLSRLEAAFRSLRDTPEGPSQQRAVLDAGRALLGQFGDLEAAVRAGREAADRDIAGMVDDANRALVRIADLNDEIATGRASGYDVAGLMDERDRQLDGLSALIGIRTAVDAGGDVMITTKEGITLLDGEPRLLDFTASTTIPLGLVLGGGLSGLTVDGADITPTGGGPQAVRSGRLAGAFAVRDQDFVTYQRQIDELARQTIALFQTADASVTGAPPADTGLFTDAGGPHDPLVPADPVPGLAGRIALNPLVDPAAGGNLSALRDGVHGVPTTPGATTQIDAFIDAFNSSLAFAPAAGLDTDGTLLSYADALTAGHQLGRVQKEGEAEGREILRAALHAEHVNTTGVNVDAESSRLLELEQAYAANAQVISTISRMFDELIANLR
jgi:flagellar hook-associated protein 1 FlgK